MLALQSACVVSFDGYELGASSSTSGGGAGAAGSTTTTSASGSAGEGGSGGGGATGASSGGTGGAGGDGGTAGASAGGAGAGGAGASGGAGGSSPSCPTDGGDMVAIPKPGGGAYCIDVTEVTQQHYQSFLASGPDVASQPAECQGNTTFTPSCAFNPVNTPQRPVVCVDWCDARAFCAFVGKRLCGALDGGPNPPNASTDAGESQWFRACTGPNQTIFPYGNVYDGDKCNGLDANTTGVVAVGSFAQCVGGYAGLFDMSGNAREWEDSCGPSGCLQRGGGWLDYDTSMPHSLRCNSSGMAPRLDSNDNDVGFRCCADL